MDFHPLSDPSRRLGRPVVLGHYLPWYTLRGDAFPLHPDDAAPLDFLPEVEDMRHWHDRRAGYRRTHHHMPEIGVYDSRDPDVIRWQIRSALEHGITGFIINWYGTYSVENIITLHFLRELEAWNRQHPEQTFHYCLSYDMQAQWPSEGKKPVTIEEDFHYIKTHLMRDAYLCRDGRPLFLFFPYGDERKAFRRVLDRTFETGADLLWSGAPEPDSPEDASYAWVKPDRETVDESAACTWTDPDNCGAAELTRFYDETNAARHEHYIMHGVWPGFDSSLVAWAWSANPDDPNIRPRVMCRETSDGSTLDRTWRPYLDYLRRHTAGDASAAVPAPLVQLVTWNDYAEATTLEPSRDFGRAPLETCRRWIAEAKAICGGG